MRSRRTTAAALYGAAAAAVHHTRGTAAFHSVWHRRIISYKRRWPTVAGARIRTHTHTRAHLPRGRRTCTHQTQPPLPPAGPSVVWPRPLVGVASLTDVARGGRPHRHCGRNLLLFGPVPTTARAKREQDHRYRMSGRVRCNFR